MRYDVIVIGAGSAGLNVAVPAAKLGLKTLLIERKPENLGGECLNTGCVPSKALLHVAKLKQDAEKLSAYGITTNGSLDFTKVFRYVKNVQDDIRKHESSDFLKLLGVELAFGAARFTSKNSIEVEGKTYRGRRIILATGSRPRIPYIPGINHVRYLTNENLFDIQALPGKLLILGGGPIGVEMAQAFARLGSQVTVVEQSSRLLARDPQEASDVVRMHLEQEGVKFYFHAKITAFPSPNVAEIQTSIGMFRHPFDQILIAVGKVLDYDELGLETAGITLEQGRIRLDTHLRTTNKRVYVSGDATGQIYLTHATELHGSVILWNLFSPLKKRITYDDMSWVTFTDPEVATFGLSEEELRKRRVAYRKVVQSFEDVNRATTDNYPESKLIVYLKRDQILGGTMIAPNAGELVQELILAKQNKIPLRKLLEKVYPYPTATRINRWFAIWEYDRKMTEGIKKVLRGAFRLVG